MTTPDEAQAILPVTPEDKWQAAWDALPDGMHAYERARQAGIDALSQSHSLPGDGKHLHAMHETVSGGVAAREALAKAFEPQFPVEAEMARKGLHFMLPSSWAVEAIQGAIDARLPGDVGMLDRIAATIDSAQRILNESPFWDKNSKRAGEALLDYPRSQIAAERAAIASAKPGEPWPGCYADLQQRRVTTLAKLGLMLSVMAGGDAFEVVGYDAAELYAEVLMALAIEDADDTDMALEEARDHPDSDIMAVQATFDAIAALTPSALSGDAREGEAQRLQDHMEQHHGVCLSASEWDAAIRATFSSAGDAAREQGQREGKAAVCQWLRGLSATIPPGALHHAAAILADGFEQSELPSHQGAE